MSEPFLGEVRIFGFNFAPRNWALCTGQVLPIAQNTALFSLLGTQYGGTGTTTFALPNLQGAIPAGMGTGAGLSPIVIGETGGTMTEVLNVNQIPSHTHSPLCNNDAADSASPGGEVWAPDVAGSKVYAGGSSGQMAPGTLTMTGGSLPHNNLQPLLVLNYCIALAGIFPSRN